MNEYVVHIYYVTNQPKLFFFYVKFYRLLRDEYEQLQNNFTATVKEIEQYKKERLDLDAKLLELNAQCNEYKLKITIAEEKLLVLEKSCSAIKKDLEQKTKEIKHLSDVERQLQEYQCMNSELKEKNTMLQADLQKAMEQEQHADEIKTLTDDLDKVTTENQTILRQMYEIQKMHVFKVTQLQAEINNHKKTNDLIIKDLEELRLKCRSEQSFNEKEMKIHELEKHLLVIKNEDGTVRQKLLGENDELRSKNQHLTLEIDELRGRLQKDRKSRRHSTHDEKRHLLFCGDDDGVRSIETQTQDPNASCGCKEMDKQIKELQRDIKIKECQIGGMLIKMTSNPLRIENENLKKVSNFN